MKLLSKKTIIFSLLILLLVALGIYYVFFSMNSNSIEKKPATPTAEIKDKPVGQIDYGKPSADQTKPATDNLPTTSSPSSTTATKPIPTQISYAGGSPLQVRVVISEILSTGSCTLTLQKSGSTVTTQTVDVFPTASSSTCKGFTVDTSSLPKGVYSISVTVNSSDRKGTAVSTVTI